MFCSINPYEIVHSAEMSGNAFVYEPTLVYPAQLHYHISNHLI